MSYIVEIATKESFLENNTKSKRNIFSVTLNQFAVFTTDIYSKKSETVLKDVIEITKKEDNHDEIYTILNQYVQWLVHEFHT